MLDFWAVYRFFKQVLPSRTAWTGLEPVTMKTRALFLFCLLLGVARGQTVPRSCDVEVCDTSGAIRCSEPVCSGVPLPRGAVYDTAQLRLERAGDSLPLACQIHRLGASWPDGSLRWILLQFQADVPARGRARYRLRFRPAQPPLRVARAPALKVELQPDRVRLVSAGVRWTFSRSDFALPNQLEVYHPSERAWKTILLPARLQLTADRESMTPAEFVLSGRKPEDLDSFGLADSGTPRWGKLRTQDFSGDLRGPVSIRVEESGPLRAVLRVESSRPAVEGRVGFVTRIYAYAGKPFCKFEYTLQNFEQYTPVAGPQIPNRAICNSKHIRRFRYSLQPGSKVMAVKMGLSPQPLQSDGEKPLNLSESLQQTAHAPGWATLACGEHQLGVATRWFWEIAPKALDYQPGVGLHLDLWPESAQPGYPLAAGRAKTYEFVLGVDQSGPELSNLLRHELHAIPSPDYVAATGASYRTVNAADSGFSQFYQFIEHSRQAALRAQLYGDLDFGDQIGWNAQERWNGYHDGASDWFLFYLSTGHPELFRLGEQTVWHVLDVDTQNWGYQPGSREGATGRAYDHVCTSQVQGVIYSWHLGELNYYLLTGRRRVYESLLKSCDFLLHSPGVRAGSYVPERQSALPMLNLAYLVRALGDDQALPGKRRPGSSVQTDSLGRQRSHQVLEALAGLRAYFGRVLENGELQQFCVYPAYLAEAFYELHQITGKPEARAGILSSARLLSEKMALNTGAIRYAPGAPWPDESRHMPWWDGVQAPAAYAYELTGRKSDLEGGRATADWLLNYRQQAYSSSPFGWQGAGGYAASLAHYLWALQRAGLNQAYLLKSTNATSLREEMALCNLPQNAAKEAYQRLAAEIGRQLVSEGRLEEARLWLLPWQSRPGGEFALLVLRRLDRLLQQK